MQHIKIVIKKERMLFFSCKIKKNEKKEVDKMSTRTVPRHIPYFQSCMIRLDAETERGKRWIAEFAIEKDEVYRFEVYFFKYEKKQWRTIGLKKKKENKEWTIFFDTVYRDIKTHASEQVLRLLKKYSKERIRLTFITGDERLKNIEYPEPKELTINE